ncbi:MAG TPA: hypothetical protein VNK95_17255 [Caldilineaceae bacterium]|nr:hypothetical protein [Caldilineaceae bacterium]
MSILCCRVPDFALALTYRERADWCDQPLALLGLEERICALSPAARRNGVRLGMTPRQAQMRCADLQMQPVDLNECREAQAALLSTLGRWELPVEEQSWGLAYIDLHTVARRQEDVQGLATDLGRQVRAALGQALQPALGWDSSKFTARAAAAQSLPGRLRLVSKANEGKFLAPLSVRLLPLPPDALQRLHWLGIRTLAQFAALPPAAVYQQFGAAGRTAQRWAQGKDDRPVRNTLQACAAPIAVELDPPCTQLAWAVDAVVKALTPHLRKYADRLEGLRSLRLALNFAGGETHSLALDWIEPVSQPARLRSRILAQMGGLVWPAPLVQALVTQQQTAELPTEQLSLFAAESAPAASVEEMAARLRGRYGAIFYRGMLTDSTHAADERRFAVAAL